MSKKPVMLCIMDGFGWVPEETFGNAVVAAKKPHLDALMAKYPMTTIEASGMAVGLPDGQMGNSEVGHTNMGAGRRPRPSCSAAPRSSWRSCCRRTGP